MIKTLSPHYVSVPLVNPLTSTVCASYTIKIYVWNGSKVAIPADSSYEITKINAAISSGTDKLNIARIVNDFIEFQCEPVLTTSLVDGNNQQWVKYEICYDDMPDIPVIEEVLLAVKGYGYFLEGENPQVPANKILLTGDEFKVNRNGLFVLPVIANEPPVADRVLTITAVNRTTGYNYKYSTTSNFIYSSLFMEARSPGDTDWTPIAAFPALTPDTIAVPSELTTAPFETRVSAFDLVTSTRIYSNIFTTVPLKIWKVEPAGSGGFSINVFYYLNITDVSGVDLQIYGYSGPYWSSNTYDANSPRFFNFTPSGSFKIRLFAVGNYSNEVDITIPLINPIIIL